MAEIIKLPEKPEAPITVTLTGAEWFAIMLKLAGREAFSGRGQTELEAAEAKMLHQLKGDG